MPLTDGFMEDSKVFALKGHRNDGWGEAVSASLHDGVGRFGWSYIQRAEDNLIGDADLRRIAEKSAERGYAALSEHERDCNQTFLLDLQPGDWVVYINLPQWGQCTLARVTAPYFWRAPPDEDFNHCFGIDPRTVRVFDRNDQMVPAALRARLVLQGRYWRIYAHEEFGLVLQYLDAGVQAARRTPAGNAAFLQRQLEPQLAEMTRIIQRANPNYDLEALLELVFQTMPGVRRVTRQGGAGDHGADLIVEYEGGPPIPALQRQHTCLVQVKSHTGRESDRRAVDDIRRALERYPTADTALIVSTADESTPEFDRAMTELRELHPGKRIELLIGSDVARFVLQFGGDLLRRPPPVN